MFEYLRLVIFSLSLLQSRGEDDVGFRFQLAVAIVSVTSDQHEQNVLMSIARWETNYIERLASPRCECKRNECDNGRAKGSWQIIPYNKEESTRLCVSLEDDARIALARIRESESACRHLPANERLAVYTRGNCTSEIGRKLSRIRWVR